MAGNPERLLRIELSRRSEQAALHLHVRKSETGFASCLLVNSDYCRSFASGEEGRLEKVCAVVGESGGRSERLS